MKTDIQIADAPRYPAYRMVLHHDQTEDFTVYAPAGFVLRWYALTLDLALAAPTIVLIHLPFTRYLEHLAAYGHDGKRIVIEVILNLVPLLGYFVAPTLLYGRTLGKKIVGLRVVGANCQPTLSPGKVFFRETFGKALSLALFGCGFFMVSFNSRRRGLHDYLAQTMVISYRDR